MGKILIIALIILAAIPALYFATNLGNINRAQGSLVIATTTSLYDTGLLDELARAYWRERGVELKFVAVGSGLALERARRGDADLVLVHAPDLELEFVREGYGVDRRPFAFNFFVILGPRDDPAGIGGLNPIEAMRKIAEAGREGRTLWISRGDLSGTNVRELYLWRSAGFDPEELREEGWYVESGAGMGKTLMLADEKLAYTLSDLGTYLAYRDRIDLVPLVERGKELMNVYSVILVNPEKVRGVRYYLARDFEDWLLSDEAQEIIAGFGGGGLFHPISEALRDPQLRSWLEEMGGYSRGDLAGGSR